MVTRRALVVGSQCDRLSELRFLPQLADELADVLEAEDHGCWQVTRRQNPEYAELTGLITATLQAADDDSGIVLIALIGHGKTSHGDYYFMPSDGKGTGTTDPDLHLVQHLKEQLKERTSIAGLVLLVDTCESGVVATDADTWLRFVRFPYHIMTAASGGNTERGDFTRALIDTLRQGTTDCTARLDPGTVYQHVTRNRDVKARDPQNKAKGDPRELWIARNPAHSRVEHGPRRVHPPIDIGATDRRPLDGYCVPDDARNPLHALALSEHCRVQLGVIWALDRRAFVGVAVDLPGSDLTGDLAEVEDTIVAAATEASVALARRRWIRLPVRPGPLVGAELRLDRPVTPAADDDPPTGFVVQLDLDQVPRMPSVREWHLALQAVLTTLRDGHPTAAIVLSLRTPSLLDGVHAALRIADAVHAGMPERRRPEVVTRFVPGADEEGRSTPPAPDPQAGEQIAHFVDRLAAAEGWDPIAPPPGVHPEELVAGIAARWATDARANGALLERVRVYAGPLWRPVLRRCARSDRPQAGVLEIAARLDEDLETWLDARSEVGGLRAEDLPPAGRTVPDALGRILRWRHEELPGWLTRRLTRGIRAAPPQSRDDALLELLRFRPVTAEWAREVLRSPVLRSAVYLVPPQPSTDRQLLLHVEEVHAATRPSPILAAPRQP